MRRQTGVKAPAPCGAVVAVIASEPELRHARKMSCPPDLFELRLDCLPAPVRRGEAIAQLPAPLIVTARDPAEGGRNRLSLKTRRQLLGRFLPYAKYIDVELRSARFFTELLEQARAAGVGTIISMHDFRSTPTLGRLRAKALAARAFDPAVFKVATRTDTPAQLARLLEFALRNPTGIPLSVLGMGKLGPLSRILLAQSGSALIYTSLQAPVVEGQISLERFRAAIRAAKQV